MKKRLVTIALLSAAVGCSDQQPKDVSELGDKGQFAGYTVAVRDMPSEIPGQLNQEVTLRYAGKLKYPTTISGWRTYDPNDGVRFHDVWVMNLEPGKHCYVGPRTGLMFENHCDPQTGGKYINLLVSGYSAVQRK
jgi:hypothetical protein